MRTRIWQWAGIAGIASLLSAGSAQAAGRFVPAGRAHHVIGNLSSAGGAHLHLGGWLLVGAAIAIIVLLAVGLVRMLQGSAAVHGPRSASAS